MDIYDENSVKVDILKMPDDSPIKISTSRIKEKDKILGVLKMPKSLNVDVTKRLDLIKRRNRAPIIYHKITADREFSTFNVQLQNFNPHKYICELVENKYLVFFYSKLAIMAKFGRMMLADDCDFIKVVNDVDLKDGGKCIKIIPEYS